MAFTFVTLHSDGYKWEVVKRAVSLNSYREGNGIKHEIITTSWKQYAQDREKAEQLGKNLAGKMRWTWVPPDQNFMITNPRDGLIKIAACFRARVLDHQGEVQQQIDDEEELAEYWKAQRPIVLPYQKL